MADFGIYAGDTDKTIYVRLRDSTTGLAKTGLVFNSAGAVASYTLPLAARAAITLATQTVTGAHSDGGFVEVDATNCKGLYRLDLPDAAIASGAFTVISIEFDGIIEESILVPLHTPKANVTQWLGTAAATPTVAGVPEVDITHVAGATTDVSALATNVAAILVDTGTTLQAELDGIQADTEDIQGRLPAALTAGGNIKADALAISGDTTAADNLETAFDDTAGAVPWTGIVDQGTAQSATSTTVVLRAGAAFADDTLIGKQIEVFGSDQGYWQGREITDNTLADDTVVVDAWTTTPTGTIDYKISFGSPALTTLPAVNVTQLSGDSTAADNAESFFDGTGYAGTNNVIPTVTTVTTCTNLTNAPTAGDLTATMKASVNTEVDSAIETYHLDHLLAVDYDPASKPGTATALLNELVENDGGVSRFTANALEQAPSGGGTNPLVIASGTIGATGNDTTHLHLTGLTFGDDELNDLLIVVYDDSASEYHSQWISDWADTGDLATLQGALPFTPEDSTDTYVVLAIRQDVTGGSGLDAAGVRAAIGLASANLDTQLGAITDDTNELQTDWADDGRLDLILDARASQTSVDTVDNFIDTEIATIITDIAAVKSDTAAILLDTGTDGVIVAEGSKAGYALSATGLDLVVPADPSAIPVLGTASVVSWIGFFGAWSVNEVNSDSDSVNLRNSADNADLAAHAISDDGTTFVSGEAT